MARPVIKAGRETKIFRASRGELSAVLHRPAWLSLSAPARGILSFLLLLVTPLLAAEAPKRVVSLAPSHTEIVLALGAGASLAGVSDAEQADTLPGLPRVGGLSPNWEVLASLKPDLILADVSHRRGEEKFQRLGLPVLYLPSTRVRSVEDVFGLIRQVGDRLERGETAEKLVRGMEARLKTLEARVPPGGGPTIYFEIWPQPLQACAPGSLQGHLIARAGGRNILPAGRTAMPLVSREWVAKASPEVVLHPGVVASAEIAARPGWSAVRAVRAGRVHQVDRDLFSRAGPRILDAFENLLRLFYETPAP